MNAFIKVFVPVYMLFFSMYTSAQTDTIRLSSEQVEDVFIKQNLQLIAEKLNVDKADAAIIQAKLWPNPTLTIDQVNFWSTNSQRQGVDEVIPPFSGTFGKNLEFGLGIDQVILMGGKRGKLVDMEKISKDMSVRYFEELVCNLKAELRSVCAELRYAQQYFHVLDNQQIKLMALIGNYREQAKQGNISQNQLLRLQAALLEVQSELNDVQKEMNLQQKNVRTLLNISTPVYIFLTDEGKKLVSPEELSFGQLSDLATTMRPDLKRVTLQTDYFKKSIRYEKSQRIPDITLHASYDRGGNCMLDFVGFGVSVDLPFFNRNQGAVKAAEVGHKQSLLEVEQMQNTIFNEVIQALDNYRTAYLFSHRISDEFIFNLEEIQESYTRNFVNKNIGIVEFLDFFDTYKENKRTMLAAQKNARVCFEELQLAVGTEIN